MVPLSPPSWYFRSDHGQASFLADLEDLAVAFTVAPEQPFVVSVQDADDQVRELAAEHGGELCPDLCT